jgi:MoaA/NifB/PqqE/SkfB family radical SAM enzyme
MDSVRAWNTFQAYLDLLLRRSHPRAYPLELSLGTSAFCNLRCIMCPRVDHEGNRMPFDQPVSLEYFRGLKPYLRRAKEVSLYGLGEPFIDNQYFDEVALIRSLGAEVTLSTNGVLLDEKRRRQVMESGIRGLGISLDATTPETYAVVRPPGGFDTVVENLRALSRLRQERGTSRPLIVVSFAMMRQNLDDVPAFPQLVKSVGADEAVIHTSIYMSPAMKTRIEPDADRLRERVQETLANAKRLGVKIFHWNLDPMSYLRSLEYVSGGRKEDATGNSYYCQYMWRNAMLQGKGEFFPCCYMTNHRVGTLAEGDLRVLRGRPFMAELRRLHFEGTLPAPCVRCPQLFPYDRRRLAREGYREIRAALRHSIDGVAQQPVPH